MPEHFIKVRDIVQQHPLKKPESAFDSSSSNISNSNGDICRICHCEADIGNPLLSPCYCSGSLKYVHQSCLQQWLAASDTKSCELCKFHFILQTKIKPISEWRRLEMSSIERRRLLCAILFHFVAAVCVVWSLFVLIDRAAEEVNKGLIAWPFWTKLVVVAVGFTGGTVFMYIQCRQYFHLFSRWKAHNRIILVQNAPEKVVARPPSPITVALSPPAVPIPAAGAAQVIANVHQHPPSNEAPAPPPAVCYTFNEKARVQADDDRHSNTSFDRKSVGANSCDALERNIREILALDVEFAERARNTRSEHGLKGNSGNVGLSPKTAGATIGGQSKSVFKSLPNLSASSENLLK